MKRRDFLLTLAAASAALPARGAEHEQLRDHRIARLETGRVRLRWPRPVGKNAQLGVHGRGPTIPVVRVTTDIGASGWGELRGPLPEEVKQRRLTELFDPATGVIDPAAMPLDFALHDLAGMILGIPVYKMLGEHGPPSSPCYSGMIYFDDLEPPENPSGISAVLANAESDLRRGYRQLKVKIGRGNRWMPRDVGLHRDIDVTRAIADRFREAELLVDGNNGFALEQIQRYVEGIDPVPLFWIEEPFHENEADYVAFREWLAERGRSTRLADGEARPDWAVLNRLSQNHILDVQLVDIAGYGLTAWRQLMPKLKEWGVEASPHAWGHILKTHYTSHLASGLGIVVTIEGVTCESDDARWDGYELKDGQLTPSPEPGFGMALTA